MTAEQELRARLGIPSDAERVLIVGETTHWDPNWLMTSDGYFRWRVRRTLDQVLDALDAEPRRVFGIECTFFLRMFWERCEEQRERVAARLADGRLRMLGPGVTTPDTLLPETESVLRDLLVGQEWLRSIGCPQEPRTLYLPDDFGHSPALPQLLGAAGIDRAAFSRIDGMFFPGADYRGIGHYPRPGSTAETLWRDEASADFVWEGADGSELLSHWCAHTYFMGDMLAARGVIRWMGITFGLPSRGEAAVARRLEGFARRLGRLARTPYRFCPVGCDFNGPIPGLVALLDRYDEKRFPDSGLYVVNAGLDDYLALVDHHRDALPRLQVDPNPYWMGFYASRPKLKHDCRRLARGLLAAEAAAGGDPDINRHLADAWDTSVLSNHHDFVTGTSPERVFRAEQRPAIDAALAELEPEPPSIDGSPLDASDVGLELISFADSGGLWRMGHEFRGGRFEEVARSTGERLERADVELQVARADDGRLHVEVSGRLPRRRTWCLAWTLPEGTDRLRMDVPGGDADRPAVRELAPTFWAASTFVDAGGRRVWFQDVGCVSIHGGALTWVVGRHAPKERAFGVLPVLAHPARGSEPEVQTHRCVLVPPGVDPGTDPFAHPLTDDVELTGNARLLALKPAHRGAGLIARVAVQGPASLRIRGTQLQTATLCTAREVDIGPLEVMDGAVVLPSDRAIVSLRMLTGA